MKHMLVVGAILLSLGTTCFAQSAPNRAAAVCAVTGARPEVFQGTVEQSDARRLAFLPTIISALNHIDGGNWGELLKETGTIPADIIVWRPTLEHFDVMTDSGCYWGAKGVIAASWKWLAVADGEPVTVPPVIVPPPPVIPSLVVDYDRIAAVVKVDGDVTRAQLKAHDESPSYFVKIFGNRYVQMVLAAAGAYFAEWQAAHK